MMVTALKKYELCFLQMIQGYLIQVDSPEPFCSQIITPELHMDESEEDFLCVSSCLPPRLVSSPGQHGLGQLCVQTTLGVL